MHNKKGLNIFGQKQLSTKLGTQKDQQIWYICNGWFVNLFPRGCFYTKQHNIYMVYIWWIHKKSDSITSSS